MNVAFAADHAGWPLRDGIFALLARLGHVLVDCGPPAIALGDDYPDRALDVGRAIVDGRAERGIVACGSGVGACVAANKIVGIRACLCHDTFSARQGVEDDDMNVLCLGARIIGASLVGDVLEAFLGARYVANERHARRVAKIAAAERRNLGGP